MHRETQFRLFSYAAVFCGFLSLWVSGTFGAVETSLFVLLLAVGWRLEDTKWQIKERLGTVLIVLSIPAFYLLFRFRFLDFSNAEAVLPGVLARLILSLSAIKILQKKSGRDWMFLYVMSFFQVLLAAGLSISIGYLASFTAYVFTMACTIILFEIRKVETAKGQLELPSRTAVDRLSPPFSTRKVLAVGTVLILIIAVFAVPVFFMLPRVGGAGIGAGSTSVSSFAGFSDTVKLGGFGRIRENDEVVMRVRVEGQMPEVIHWRGIALDIFDGQSWSKSKPALREPKTRNESDLVEIDVASEPVGLTLQTVYLEPLDTPIMFGLSRMVRVQTNFPVLYRDVHGSVSFQRTGERVSYKLVSDTEFPSESRLRADTTRYPAELSNYLQLPARLDPRVGELSSQITAAAQNRFDSARAIESYLQSQFGYTLEQKAGGADPLSDFLFDKREGHCEYFATSMAIMLRTQGIATRVVNGFQRGEYNDAADVYVVRQRNAHSWVEVYFPETGSWIEFDPTPFAGRSDSATSGGITDKFRKYAEALETFWIQYFVAFDTQEQRSLFVSVRRGVNDYQSGISSAFNVLQAELELWWKQVRGDAGFTNSVSAVGLAILWMVGLGLSLLLVGWFIRKAVKLKVWSRLWNRLFRKQHANVVEFYERMQTVLAGKGFIREAYQTPLEFAYGLGMPEAVSVTERYNDVRFGERDLTAEEANQIEIWLKDLEEDRQ